MAKKTIKARNVVDFSTGTVVQKVDEPAAEAPKPVKTAKKVTPVAVHTKTTEETVADVMADAEADEILESVKEVRSLADEELIEEAEAAPAERPAPVEDEPLETKPLTMRTSKYLDETPQDPDWADEEDTFLTDTESEEAPVSTFAEVFIPLHDDSTATIIRKGMVIVSVIVILCCLVAILMKHGQVSALITPDFTDLSAQAHVIAAAAGSLLL